MVSSSVASLGSLRLAVEAEGRGDHRAAWHAALEAIAIRPFHPEAWMQMANTALTAEDPVAALNVAERATELAPRWKLARDTVALLRKELSQSRIHPRVQSVLWPQLPGRRSTPRLTVCMIVRNEERFLEQCLQSVQPIASQTVILDTGSTDATVDIARRFGAEIHHFEWCENFATARNVSLQYAREDWILTLDADEELPPDSILELQRLMADPQYIGYRIQLMDLHIGPRSTVYVPRLFRNAPGIFFKGRIHEDAFSSVFEKGKDWSLDVGLGKARILHHGYAPEIIQSRGKAQRNLGLLINALSESPGDYGLMTKMGFEFMRAGRVGEAFDQYRKAVSMAESLPQSAVTPEALEALITQFSAYLSQAGSHAEVVQLLTSPLAGRCPSTPTSDYLFGLSLLRLKRVEEAVVALEKSRGRRNELTLYSQPFNLAGPLIEFSLADAYELLGNPEQAGHFHQAALSLDLAGPLATSRYARFLGKQNRIPEALQLLHSCLQVHPQHIHLWVQGGQLALSEAEFSEVSYQWAAEGRRLHPAQPHLAEQWVLSCLQMDLPSEAWSAFSQLNPPSPELRIWAGAIIAAVACDQGLPSSAPACEIHILSQAVLEVLRRLILTRAVNTVGAFLSRIDRLREVLPLLVQSLRESGIDTDFSPPSAL